MPQIDSAQTECSHKGPDFLNTAGGGQGNAGRILVPTSRSGAKILQPWTTRSARVVTIKIRSSTQVSGLDTCKIWRRGRDKDPEIPSIAISDGYDQRHPG